MLKNINFHFSRIFMKSTKKLSTQVFFVDFEKIEGNSSHNFPQSNLIRTIWSSAAIRRSGDLSIRSC